MYKTSLFPQLFNPKINVLSHIHRPPQSNINGLSLPSSGSATQNNLLFNAHGPFFLPASFLGLLGLPHSNANPLVKCHLLLSFWKSFLVSSGEQSYIHPISLIWFISCAPYPFPLGIKVHDRVSSLLGNEKSLKAKPVSPHTQGLFITQHPPHVFDTVSA